jgi:hypothetical protein
MKLSYVLLSSTGAELLFEIFSQATGVVRRW